MISKEITNRKGARKLVDIPSEVLTLLNQGKIQTVNLTEWLAVDQIKLVNTIFPEIGLEKAIVEVTKSIGQLKKPSTMSSIKVIGETLYNFSVENNTLEQNLKALSNHISDTLRCYAPYLISLNTNLSIEEKLEMAKPLVADSHFGIREVVWMALRPEIDKNLSRSIQYLSQWTSDKDENIRRFTTEATRPRGVWCKHIENLKENPELALPILEPLKSDSSKYVQDSVGNWLNDASKTRPDFVVELSEKWREKSPTKETEKIIKRARRSIDK
ncbi:DNA alkylation repair protein [Aureibaculum sp. 2210JD6-5]|uniref:DNA alkylation repair protein n=1 Tax=Aureibaculum sp. 2210JD6-5 TaxID=3103957 RepID=UPI002AADA223|nr:DNA alkylation repair protein [Aureibaculum sp. 2210JD6-5]MDY7395337.1 DNA alkylation repair protein [Aureibaculum sp. 2210JD6-5]